MNAMSDAKMQKYSTRHSVRMGTSKGGFPSAAASIRVCRLLVKDHPGGYALTEKLSISGDYPIDIKGDSDIIAGALARSGSGGAVTLTWQGRVSLS